MLLVVLSYLFWHDTLRMEISRKNSCFAIVWNPLRGERMFSMKFLNIFEKGDLLGIMLVRALLMVLLPCLEIALDSGTSESSES